MTPGQLVKAVSIALDVPEETVVQHDRNLVVAGLRTTGARGRNAPSVTHHDAARLVGAILGSVRVKDSVSVVERLEKTKFRAILGIGAWDEKLQTMSKTEEFSDQAITTLPPNHNFVDAIASLIGDASGPVASLDGCLRRFAPLMISCQSPWGNASIGHMEMRGHASYQEDREKRIYAPLQKEGREKRPLHERYAKIYGITQRRDAQGTAIILLGHAFREDGLDFTSTKAALEACYGEKLARQPKRVVAA